MLRSFLLASAAIFGFVSPAASQSQGTLIINASVIDGTGAPARRAEVRLLNGKIYSVGQSPRVKDDRIIDAKGMTLAPGFIDTHSHHDVGLSERRDALGAVSQGITTIIAGQDGFSQMPLSSFFRRLDSLPVAINVGSYAGHGAIRSKVMGDDYKRVATDAEVERMRAMLREEMDAGALGLSTGLEYNPGFYSARSEVLELAKVAGKAGGRYISHMRSEDREFWDALDELITIGRVAKLPVQVSHTKLAMRGLWGQGNKLVQTLDRARRDGVQVTADVYPYTMWQSTLTVLYPKRNFTDRAETDFILKDVAAPEDLLIGAYALNKSYEGKNVAEITKLRGTDAATTLMALISESQAAQADENVIATGMDERDIASIMRWPFTNFCSDGELEGAHPRGFGTFPRILGHYVRDLKVLTLEEAIRKMTSLPAANVGITDRGAIRAGLAADLVLFDPRTIIDHATVKAPHAISSGIATVWVNGSVVFENGKTTGAHPGKTLRRVTKKSAADLQSKIDEYVRAEMAAQKIPGLAVAVVNKGAVSARGYGYANVEHMVPVTDETIFQSGSLGKMFTATGVMLLVEEGKLSLADTITKFFPDAPPSWRGITVRNLLNHTSGIPDYTTETFDYRKDYTEDELAHFAFQQKLEFSPGSRWNYSNTGYVLLGIIVHKASGMFYGDFLAERVFKPLGMTTTRIISEADIVRNRAAGYDLVKGELKNQEWVAPKLNTTADGSLYWSLGDLVAWDSAVKRRALLKTESWSTILTPVRLNSGKTYPYGMGWQLDERAGRPLQQHGGAWQGFTTQYSRFLGNDLDIIVLANLSSANPGRIANGIAALVDSSLAVKRLAPIADNEPQTAAKVIALIDKLRNGTITNEDFAYVRAGFFPQGAKEMKADLATLGKEDSKLILYERREIGDDRIYTYELSFPGAKRYVIVGYAPDGRISVFGFRTQP